MHLRDIRQLKRFKDILVILAKHGFEEIVQHLEGTGGELLRKVYTVDTGGDIYARIRLVLTDLGSTFIKFGQLMSLRPDFLPAELIREMEKLQDEVPPVDSDAIVEILDEQLGRSVKEVFSIFDVEPIAAASMSQVHKGVMKENNRFVAIKVRRPGIEEQIVSDLDILETIGNFLHEQFAELQPYQLPELVAAIRTDINKELDFRQELHNMRTARAYASGSDIYVPETFDAYCSRKILIMEFVPGERFRDIGRYSDFERHWIAKTGLMAAVRQILEDGFFHADPHPGNLLVMNDMRLCLIDWGLVGRLTENDRNLLIELMKAVTEKDSEALVSTFLRFTGEGGEFRVDVNSLEREFLVLLDRYASRSIRETNFGELFMNMISLVRTHNLRLPADLVIMVKALVTAEGSARQACPELNVVEELRDYIALLARKRFSPERMWRNVRGAISQLLSIQQALPRRFENLTTKLERGEFKINLQHNKLENLVNSFERASNKLTAGIVTGAIIIGSSMIITTGVEPFLFGFPALGVVGYILSVILGIWLLFTIFRGGGK